MWSDFSLVSLMLDLSSIQVSTQTGTLLGKSLSSLAFIFDLVCGGIPFYLKCAYTGSVQSFLSVEFTSYTQKCSLSF